MTTTDIHPPSRHFTREGEPGFLARAEAWLDDHGKGAWIAAMIGGFIFVWPVGLALLAYMIWSKRMFSGHKCYRRGRHVDTVRSMKSAARPSGNAAFDAYKTDTLRRLEEEQTNFEDFLERLREAKDKAEFDDFMNERARSANDEAPSHDEPRRPA